VIASTYPVLPLLLFYDVQAMDNSSSDDFHRRAIARADKFQAQVLR
jgi:hypothetical protein